jgi:hypothetical protein
MSAHGIQIKFVDYFRACGNGMVLVLLMLNSVLPVPESRKAEGTDVGIIASKGESYTKTTS